jgi:hypothetical protein
VGDQRVGDVEHQRDRNEVGERVIGQLLIEPGVEHDVAQAAHEQGITIGRRIDHRLRADDGPRAGPVLHHDALAQPLRELVREQAADDVVTARWSDRHDDLHRAIGIGLRAGGRRRGDQGAEREQHDGQRRRAKWHDISLVSRLRKLQICADCSYAGG